MHTGGDYDTTHSLSTSLDLPRSTEGHAIQSSRAAPLPNPPFVFPARPAASAPSSFSRSTGRRPMSAFNLQTETSSAIRDFPKGKGRTPAPLPNFSFSLATSAATGSSISPPLSPESPTLPRAIPPRAGGHRRGGSEFIGGDGRTGAGLGLMSTSPTKGDGILPAPTSNPTLGPAGSVGRRGHQHRRSAAISSHDLSMIIKPPTSSMMIKGGSAPTTPSALDHEQFAFPSPGAVGVKDTTTTHSDDIKAVPATIDFPARPSTRTRVGFSDTIEFIPRPLSLVSSDASSTTTVRPGHSVSNSLSSLMSIGNASPPAKERLRSLSPANASEARPSTAGPIMGTATDHDHVESSNDSPVHRSSLQLGNEPSRAAEEHTPRLIPKKYFFFGHDSSTGEPSPTKSRPLSSASEKSRSGSYVSPLPSPGLAPPDIPVPSIEEAEQPRRPSLTKKPSKKQKKVRSWAGSILGRKPRHSKKQKSLNRRSPTPPLRQFEPVPDYGNGEENALPTAGMTPSTDLPSLETNIATWKPRHLSPQEDMSPMIDLDAALGPFNTPSSYGADWEAAQRGSGPTRRRMHSAVGPYHRRAESAPEMVAFDNPRYGLHHIGSRSTMEDVFEEDEEEDWEEDNTLSHKGSQTKIQDEASAGLGINIRAEDAEKANTEKVMDWDNQSARSSQKAIRPDGIGAVHRHASGSSKSGVSIRDDGSESGALDESALSRPSSRAKSSLSSPTPPLRPHVSKELPPLDSPSMVLPQPFLTPSSIHSTIQSSFPSPRSPISYDPQRTSTATSSFTDENTYHSLLLGEPGPAIRMSVDDVPSLTSSNSTMTRESVLPPDHPGFGNPQFRNGQRSASLSGPSATRKRSSIASLSRLLHSSHGEKSKLSIEERPPTSPERRAKEGRGKRLSRMMQFWRPRDGSP